MMARVNPRALSSVRSKLGIKELEKEVAEERSKDVSFEALRTMLERNPVEDPVNSSS